MNLMMKQSLFSTRKRWIKGRLIARQPSERRSNAARYDPNSPVRRGQGLVEFALILPVVALIIFGALDLGRAFYASITVTNAAREGARAYTRLQVSQRSTASTVVREAVEREIIAAGLDTNLVPALTLDCESGTFPNCGGDAYMRVTVVYNFDLLMLGWLFPNTIPLRRSVEMMVP